MYIYLCEFFCVYLVYFIVKILKCLQMPAYNSLNAICFKLLKNERSPIINVEITNVGMK